METVCSPLCCLFSLHETNPSTVGIIRTMVAEMVPEKVLQPKAFSLMPLVWSAGSVFGPAFGGFFARPAEQYPNLFGRIEFFKQYPFVLPNLMACCVFFISFMTALLFLKVSVASRAGYHWSANTTDTFSQETHHNKRHKRDWGLALGEKLTRPFKRRPKANNARRRRLSFVDDEASAPLLADSTMSSSDHLPAQNKPVTLQEIFTPQTSINLLAYTFLALHSVAYDQVLPVFLNYPRVVPDETNSHLPFQFTGGFGLSSDKIGTIYTIYGVACAVVQFLLFPTLCARFGVLTCYRAACTFPPFHNKPCRLSIKLTVAALVFPIVYFVTPFTALIQDTTTRYAVFLSIMLVKGFVVIIGFPCTTILLTNSASSLRILGTLNGFATTFSGMGRAIGPAVIGTVFSWGVRKGYAIAPWWLLTLVGLVGAIPPWFIVDGEGPTSSLSAGDEEDGDEGERESLLRSHVEESDEDEDVPILEAADVDSESESEACRKKGRKGYGATMSN